MSSPISELKEQARLWAALDPDPETRAETLSMLEGERLEELEAAFGQRLEFGTAGLRGRLGPGPGQMNRVLVQRVASGLGAYVEGLGAAKTAVIGFDGRKNSRIFAEDTARVLGAQGFQVYLYDEVVPTPVLSYAVVALKVTVGVMVTASHNPPQDNGYKVYWSNGAQIVPPHDSGISAAIDDVGEVILADVQELRASGRLKAPATAILENYYCDILELRVLNSTGARAVYSAMHGVGGRFVMEALRRAGHTDVLPVPEQFEPDSRFPTVDFPNPEEPGALDLALALAAQEEADLVVANDPDADRLAVAVRDGEGQFIPLSGNEVGLLLAECLMSHGGQRTKPMLATTIVSSTMLRKIASAHDAAYAETLTGFKWIANRAIAHGESGGDFVVGFEEALGYSVGPVVRDKDGVSALLLLLDLAAAEKERGRSLLDSLEDLYRRYGLHLAEQVALKLPGADGAEKIRGLMERLRTAPPTSLLGHSIAIVTDLSDNSRTVRGVREEAGFPLSNVLGFEFENGFRILARPSGTEPKIKFYFEVQAAVGEGQELSQVRSDLSKVLESLKKAFLEMLDL